MNPGKALARLNPGIMGFRALEQGSVGCGGRPELTEEDICLALALVTSDGARLLGRVMYSGHAIYREALVLHLALDVLDAAYRRRWLFEHRELDPVCRLAVREYLKPRICSYCKGQEAPPDPKNPDLKITCPHCDSKGARPWAARLRARSSGLGRKRWAAWEDRYNNDILPILDRYHDIFWEGVKKRLA